MAKTKRVTVYLDDSQYEYLQELAKKENVCMSKLLANLPYVYMKMDERPGYKYDFRYRGWYRYGHIIHE